MTRRTRMTFRPLLRAAAAALAACLLLGCTGCAAADLRTLLSGLLSGGKTAPDPTAYLSAFEDSWAYREMNDRLRACYGSLYTALTDTFAKDEQVTVEENDVPQPGIRITLPYTLSSKEEAQQLYAGFFRDNPQFFYVGNLFGLTGYEKDGAPHYDTLVLRYWMDADTRQTARQTMERAVDRILSGRPSTNDEYQTELYLHDRLASLCTYDDEAAATGYDAHPAAFSAYGALAQGRAVCEGYSRAMQLLLRRAGMRSTLVIGKSRRTGEDHMWNVVSVNGRSYHVDVTWDDSEDMLRHNYFNLSTELIELSREITPGQSAAAVCKDTADNFYIRSGTYIDTYQRRLIAASIAAQVEQGATVIELRFAPDKYDNALLFLKNGKLTAQMVNTQLTDGKTLGEYTLYGEADESILSIKRKN